MKSFLFQKNTEPSHKNIGATLRAVLAATAALAAPAASATVIATDLDIPANMDAGGQPNDYAEYIMGANGAINIQSNSVVNIGLSNSRNSLLVHNGTSWRAMGDVNVGANESSHHNRLTVSGVGTSIRGGTLRVGAHGENNHMLINAGASVESTSVFFLGDGWGSTVEQTLESSTGNNNSLTVSGSGSSLKVAAMGVGDITNRNRMEVVQGGTVTASSLLVVGGGISYFTSEEGNVENELANRRGNYNELRVADKDSTLIAEQNVIVGVYGDHNSLRVADGGRFLVGGYLTLGGVDVSTSRAMNNEVLVTGEESTLAIVGDLAIGNYGSSNTVTVADGALIAVHGGIIVSSRDGAEDNYLRINDGFIAWVGDKTEDANDLLEEGKILTWNIPLQIWENALSSDHFEMYYFETDEEAFAYTGRDGLAGYTVLGMGAVPEPGTYAALFGLAMTGYALVRRRKMAVLH